MRRPAALLCAALAAATFAGCGGGDAAPNQDNARLVLDFTPNAAHAGIYMALARDYTGSEGVRLRVQVPGASTDSVKLLLSGRVQFAILDIHDLALARERGRDLVGVMALVEDPLAAVVARPGIRTPRDLEGRKVGVTGLPSDDAVLASIVQGAGGDPAKVDKRTIGFDAVPAVVGGRVAAATAFWNVEGLAVRRRLHGARVFRVDAFGAPSYPELVLTVTRATLQDDPGLVGATVRALQRGEREALSDPESAVEAMVQRVPSLNRTELGRQLDAIQPAFQAPDGTIGTLETATLRRWAAWEQRFGIVKRKPEVALAFDPSFARKGAAEAAQIDG